MEWKEFEIEEVARLCGIQMKNDWNGCKRNQSTMSVLQR